MSEAILSLFFSSSSCSSSSSSCSSFSFYFLHFYFLLILLFHVLYFCKIPSKDMCVPNLAMFTEATEQAETRIAAFNLKRLVTAAMSSAEDTDAALATAVDNALVCLSQVGDAILAESSSNHRNIIIIESSSESCLPTHAADNCASVYPTCPSLSLSLSLSLSFFLSFFLDPMTR